MLRAVNSTGSWSMGAVCRYDEEAEHADESARDGKSPERPLPPALLGTERGERGASNHSNGAHTTETGDGEVPLEAHRKCSADKSNAVGNDQSRANTLH